MEGDCPAWMCCWMSSSICLCSPKSLPRSLVASIICSSTRRILDKSYLFLLLVVRTIYVALWFHTYRVDASESDTRPMRIFRNSTWRILTFVLQRNHLSLDFIGSRAGD